jgi:hypothetical protein
MMDVLAREMVVLRLARLAQDDPEAALEQGGIAEVRHRCLKK